MKRPTSYRNLWQSAALVSALCCFAPAGQATLVTYNFVNTAPTSATANAYGNVLTYAQNEASIGLTMKASAWAASGTGGAIQTAYLADFSSFSYGLGLCRQGTGGVSVASCNGNLANHQIDNVSGVTKFALFQFDMPVYISSVVVDPYNPPSGYDRDATLYYGNVTYGSNSTGLTINGVNLAGLTMSGLVSTLGLSRMDFNNSVSEAAATLWVGSQNRYNLLIVSARVTGNSNDSTPDRWKSNVLVVADTPEPATYLQISIVLFGFAFARFWRRRPKN